MTQQQKTSLFREAHQHRNLVLPNAWDAASAKIMQQSGAVAIGTTSAGISWSRGVPDGESLGRNEMLSSIKEIVDATTLPVTADIESGYGERSAQDAADTTRAVIQAGVVGINIEDTPGYQSNPILDRNEQANRIRKAHEAAQSAGIDVFINARIDIYLAGIGDPDKRMDRVMERAMAYLDAGADGVFVPGLTDLETIKVLAQAIPAPLNIMAGPGAPSVSELQEAGVARISTGPHLALSAFDFLKTMVHEVVNDGTYTTFRNRLTFQEMNASFK